MQQYVSNKTLARMAAVVAVGGAALGGYAFLIEPRWLAVTRTKVVIPGLPVGLQGLRIALLTDMHAGQGTSLRFIRRACRRAMRQRPDLIAITGDFISDDASSFRSVIDALSCLHAPLGVYAVPGNHDHTVGIETWHRQIKRAANITDLTNRHEILNVNTTRLCIAGVDDFGTGTPTLRQLPPPARRDCTILLAHNPDQAEHLHGAGQRVDLVLSGHTHGGQVRVPGIGALINPARHADLYEDGLYVRPQTQVYVSRGIGTVHLPVRFYARPEVAILELADASRCNV